MKKIMLIFSLVFLILPTTCYGEDTGESSVTSNFDASNELTSQYARKQILNGKTTSIKKKKDEVYLEFPFNNLPYMSFTCFVLNGPTAVYNGFIETIFYRDKIKIKDMYYENNPVKTDKIGVYSTDLCFTSEDGVVYHYKNVPYTVRSDKPTTFFSEVDFNKENAIVAGEIKMPASKNTFQIELFYTDNDEYHYQEVTAEKNGRFTIELNREAVEGKMYLRASDGLGNYADACDITSQGRTTFPIVEKESKSMEESHKVIKKKKTFPEFAYQLLILIFGVIIIVLLLLRLRVILKRHRRKRK